MAESRELFSQKASSYMFDWVMNPPQFMTLTIIVENLLIRLVTLF